MIKLMVNDSIIIHKKYFQEMLSLFDISSKFQCLYNLKLLSFVSIQTHNQVILRSNCITILLFQYENTEFQCIL